MKVKVGRSSFVCWISTTTLRYRLYNSTPLTSRRTFPLSYISKVRTMDCDRTIIMSRLLTLPGELRNTIYRYAVSEEKGVCYHVDECGVGWLCLHNPNGRTATERNLIKSTEDGDNKDEEDEEMDAAGLGRKRRKLDNGAPQEARKRLEALKEGCPVYGLQRQVLKRQSTSVCQLSTPSRDPGTKPPL